MTMAASRGEVGVYQSEADDLFAFGLNTAADGGDRTSTTRLIRMR